MSKSIEVTVHIFINGQLTFQCKKSAHYNLLPTPHMLVDDLVFECARQLKDMQYLRLNRLPYSHEDESKAGNIIIDNVLASIDLTQLVENSHGMFSVLDRNDSDYFTMRVTICYPPQW